MEFSEKLKNIRSFSKISQEELAHKLGVSFATINRLESGKSFPSYKTSMKVEKFCKDNKIDIGEE